MMYYGSRISDNLSKTPEGFLICHNVPIARTGYQEYLGSELPPGVQEKLGTDPGKLYKVYRSPEEVFSPATMASFEGKPFTDEHPPDLVTTQNVAMYEKGHLQNIRRGTGDLKDYLLADIICKNEDVANAIQNNLKREVSCGYKYEMVIGKHGLEQTNIRCNHVALVQDGRAGEVAAIQDSKPDAIKNKPKEGVKKMARKSIISKVLAAFAKDATPEELEQALDAINEESGAKAEDDEPKGNESALAKDVADLKAAVADCMEMIKGIAAKGEKQEATDEEKLDELEKSVDAKGKDSLENPDEDEEEENEGTEKLIEVPEKEDEEEDSEATDSAALKTLIANMRPKLLAIKDAGARKEAVNAFVSAVNDARAKKPAKNDYASLMKAMKTHAKATDNKAKTAKTMDDKLEEQCNAINKFNPHKKEGK